MVRTPTSPFTPTSPYYSPFVGGQLPSRVRSDPNALPNIPILVAAFLAILATGGPTYSFGVYATTLKDTLDLTQSQLETLGAASFAAGFISWIPGLCVDLWGSRKALVVGGLGQSVGFSLYWLVARFLANPYLPPSWWIPVLSFLSMLIFTSNNLVIGGVFKAIVVSCGLGTKGKAVGAAKAYLGLGAGVFSSLFRALPTQSDLDFLAMSACFAIGAIVVPAIFAMPTRDDMDNKGTKDDSTAQHYHIVYSGLGLLAVIVLGTSTASLLQGDGTSSSSFRLPDWLHGVLILLSWVGPILSLFLVPTESSKQKEYRRSQSAIRRKVRRAMERDHPNEQMRLLPPPGTKAKTIVEEPEAEEEERETTVVACETPQPVQDRTLTEMLQTIPAWLFLAASTILVGSGTMLTINMGQMVQSLGFPPWTTSACLAIFSVAQAVARVAAGAVSEAALQWKTRVFGVKGVPRTAFLVLCCLFAVAGHGVLAMSSDNLAAFVSGVLLTGVSFGGLWPLMVLIIGDIFGTVNHGANYMFADGFTCAVGTLSIAKFLTQSVYETNIDSEEDDTACFGDECFRNTHTIISALCFVSLWACILLLYLTRSSYGTVEK